VLERVLSSSHHLYNSQIDRVRDGVTVTEELLVDGQAVVVTKDNLHSFIHRKANYKMNIETSEQSR
jgi:hypothetical protein